MAINPTSDDWLNIASYLKEQRACLMQNLLKTGTTPEHTEFLRGQIAQIDALMNFASPGTPDPVVNSPNYGL